MSASPTSNSTTNEVGLDGDEDDEHDNLRLRKRTRRGRDFTLRRAVALLDLLKSKHRQLCLKLGDSKVLTPAASVVDGSASITAYDPERSQQHQQHRPSLSRVPSNSAGSCTDAASVFTESIAISPLSTLSFFSDLHQQVFNGCSESRMLCRLSLADHHHVVVDCNDSWAASLGHLRSNLLGRTVSELYCATSMHRFELNVQLALKHHMVVTRNMPVLEANVVVDMVAWIDPQYSHGLHEHGQIAGAASAVRHGQASGSSQLSIDCVYMHVLHLNSRPLRLSSEPSASFANNPAGHTISASGSAVIQMQTQSTRLTPVMSHAGRAMLPPQSALSGAGSARTGTMSSNGLFMDRSTSSNYEDHSSGLVTSPAFMPMPDIMPVESKYPPCAVFMPMVLEDGPDADLYVLPWSSATASAGNDTHSAGGMHTVGADAPVDALFTAKRGAIQQVFPDLALPGMTSRLLHPCASVSVPVAVKPEQGLMYGVHNPSQWQLDRTGPSGHGSSAGQAAMGWYPHMK